LQKKPAVEQNQNQVRKHKRELQTTVGSVGEEMETDLTFSKFTKDIETWVAESHRYDMLK